MASDFQILNPPKAPFWRDVKKAGAGAPGWERFVLVGLSMLCMAISFWPSKLGTFAPISMELADAENQAWTFLALLYVALIYLAIRFAKAEYLGSTAICILTMFGLFCIATTDPFSIGHNLAFGGLCLLAPCWIWSLKDSAQLGWLDLAGLGCFAGLILCGESVGIGERVVLASALIGLNVAFCKHILD